MIKTALLHLEKRKKEAAEKSAAIKEKDLPGYDPNKDDEELVLFSEDDKEDENDYPTFGNDFLESLDEDEPKYLSSAERRKQKTSDSMFNTHNTGEEWLMSDGDDLAKGFINNFRSAIGTGVEDLSFWLTENAPGYKPAQNVVEKNMAGEVADQAQNQFGNAKASGVNGNVVDFLDNASKNLSYSLLGFKAGDYAQTFGEGFDEYRKLREEGYSKEEATNKSLINAGVSLAGEKALDKGGKMLNKHLPKRNVFGLTAGTDEFVDRADDVIEFENFKKTIDDDFTYDLDSFKRMKYNEPEKWNYVNKLSEYLIKYPKSNKKFYDIFNELKKEKIKKGVPLPPIQRQAFILPEGKHDPYHIFHRMQERNITDDDLRLLMKDSKIMFLQWNGQRRIFVGEKGTCVIAKQGDIWVYKTAWLRNDNDEEFDKILEVLKNAGL